MIDVKYKNDDITIIKAPNQTFVKSGFIKYNVYNNSDNSLNMIFICKNSKDFLTEYKNRLAIYKYNEQMGYVKK